MNIFVGDAQRIKLENIKNIEMKKEKKHTRWERERKNEKIPID